MTDLLAERRAIKVGKMGVDRVEGIDPRIDEAAMLMDMVVVVVVNMMVKGVRMLLLVVVVVVGKRREVPHVSLPMFMSAGRTVSESHVDSGMTQLMGRGTCESGSERVILAVCVVVVVIISILIVQVAIVFGLIIVSEAKAGRRS